MNLTDTMAQSLVSGFFPKGWDLGRMDACCQGPPAKVLERRHFWHRRFVPAACDNPDAFQMMMGHEIARVIRKTKEDGKTLALLLPAGPMGVYKWAVYFLQQWNIDCAHVHTFVMAEWSDKDGNTLDPENKSAFEYALQCAFYAPLKSLTVPFHQRNAATQHNLPKYPEMIASLRAKGALIVTVYEIGRMMQIAFWEPQYAEEFSSEEEWKSQYFRKGARLHPLTIEHAALTRFKSRTTLVPCFANTVGPGLFLQSDYCIGGCGGGYSKDMMWQGLPLCTTLGYGPSVWIPSSFMPTLPGRLFFLRDFIGPLEAECG